MTFDMRRFVITGAPGAGKTAIVRQLELDGFSVVEEAATAYDRALALKEKLLGPDHPDVAMTLNNLAVLRRAQGEHAEAAALYRRALSAFERALGKRHPKAVACRANHARLLRVMRASGTRPTGS